MTTDVTLAADRDSSKSKLAGGEACPRTTAGSFGFCDGVLPSSGRGAIFRGLDAVATGRVLPAANVAHGSQWSSRTWSVTGGSEGGEAAGGSAEGGSGLPREASSRSGGREGGTSGRAGMSHFLESVAFLRRKPTMVGERTSACAVEVDELMSLQYHDLQ